MSGLGSSDSPQSKLIQEWAQTFITKDIDLITKPLHKDYRYITYPRSLGKPEQNREEWLEYIAGFFSIRTEDDPSFRLIAEIPGKVIVHGTNKIKTSIGVETTRESIYIAQIAADEDGSLKIKQVENFMDSKAHLDFIQAIAAAKAKN